MGDARPYDGELDRRPWYQLEDRHGGILAARLAGAVAMALALFALPGAHVPGPAVPMALAGAAAALLHLALWAVPIRWPRRLRLAVDLSLVVDAAWVGALMILTGGAASALAGLFLVTALWAALGYSARTGLKAGVLASLVVLGLVWAEDGRLWSEGSVPRLAFFWIVMAAAITGAAAGERELRVRAERLAVLHAAARGLLAASGAEEMVATARRAAGALMPGWRASVRLGAAPGDVRLARAGEEGVVVVPVPVDERVAGAIECRRPLLLGRVHHRVRLREVSALETLAAGLGSALWRAELTAAAERQSLTDGLTGIANRRAFDIELARRLAELGRSGDGSVALCLFDIDHFKSFNDTFGHQAGDGALQVVVRAIADTCRGTDIPARYGGEEMAVIMPGLELHDAERAAERIRAAVAVTEVPEREVTVSVGVAATSGGCSAELLIEAADRALYEAKEGGRNRVVAGVVAA